MSSILNFMTQRHRACDDAFATAEQAVASGDWEAASGAWQTFAVELEAHLSAEETSLFPAFEAKTGMSNGPTAVMRMEHQQMRQLINDLGHAVSARDDAQFLGLSETLMILMQQHNMKEEQILYPMSDRVIEDQAAIIATLR